MADPFIGEIRAFAFTYAPQYWATCDGQIMNIQQNTALFSIIGNIFGGDGKTNFALPNLSGRAPMDFGAGPGLTVRNWGDKLGDASVALTTSNFPPHSHGFNAATNTTATLTTAANSYLAKAPSSGKPAVTTNSFLPSASAGTQLAADAVQLAGTAPGTVPHNNMQPYLPVLLCIALSGIYPARS